MSDKVFFICSCAKHSSPASFIPSFGNLTLKALLSRKDRSLLFWVFELFSHLEDLSKSRVKCQVKLRANVWQRQLCHCVLCCGFREHFAGH